MKELEISEDELENPEGIMAKVMAQLEEDCRALILREEEALYWRPKVSAESADGCVMRGPKP